MKRAYVPASPSDGARYLVDRLWPRGVKKEELQIRDWLRELGPSHELRRWFGHEPARWDEFQKRYFAELSSKRALWEPLVSEGKRGTVTLVYSARDEERNQAVALKTFLTGEARAPGRKK